MAVQEMCIIVLGMPLVHFATDWKVPETLKYIIGEGLVDLTANNSEGESALFSACVVNPVSLDSCFLIFWIATFDCPHARYTSLKRTTLEHMKVEGLEGYDSNEQPGVECLVCRLCGNPTPSHPPSHPSLITRRATLSASVSIV